MFDFSSQRVNMFRTVKGKGFINNIINALPVELHLPGYQYCGPGTKLEKRLARGDKGINPLDAACRVHDIAYANSNDINNRHKADRELIDRAWERAKAKDSSVGEKLSALLVTNMMKAKVKTGMGMKKNITKKCGNKILASAIKNATTLLKKEKPENIEKAVKIAKKAILNRIKGNKTQVKIPRVIQVPKIGGFLPLIPIISAIGALGGITNGVSGIVKALNSAKDAKKQLQENIRHNKTIEGIALGKGLYLKPYKKGFGVVFNHHSKNY